MTQSTMVDHSVVRMLQTQVADEMTRVKQDRHTRGDRELSEADERQLALSLIHKAIERHVGSEIRAGREVPDDSYDSALLEAVDAAMYGAGELQALLDDYDVENIDINGCDEVWVTYADSRGKTRSTPVAASDADLIELVQTLAAYAGLNARPFTRANPELDLRLGDGSRLSACMSTTERPIVSIRRNRFPQMFLADLVRLGTVDEQLAGFLQAAVRARANVIVAGATDAGKTTLLRALINCIDPAERLIIVERALELGLRRHPELHPDVVEMEEIPPDADGLGGLSIGDLVRRTRRHNPSRVIVGEVIGPEVIEMLSAMSQGNDGSLSTIHARSAPDVFERLATYAAQQEGLPFPVTHALIAGSLDFVVFLAKNPLLGGQRCVTSVLEVAGSPDGHVAAAEIFAPSASDGRASRVAERPINRGERLRTAGYDDLAYGGWS
jgi:Flp pilus assembly CpaF family ATPase